MLIGNIVGQVAGGAWQMGGGKAGALGSLAVDVAGIGGGVGLYFATGGGGFDKLLENVGTGMAVANTVGSVGRLLRSVCFAPESPIETEAGAKRMDQVRKGDLIWTSPDDDPSAPAELKVVEEVFQSYGRVINIHVGGRVIRSTPNHPIFVRGKGWTPALELEPGELLRSRNGRWMPVEEVIDNGEACELYNLRVADHHTYFVGSREWGFSVWAHNACNVWHDFRAATKGQGLSQKQASDIWKGRASWTSPAGLEYGPMPPGKAHLSRVEHVLAHGAPDKLGKPTHTIFGAGTRGTLQEVDAAWAQRSTVTPALQPNGNWKYSIPRGVVGANGESNVAIIVKPDSLGNPSNKIVTAHPEW